jgi:hypothetical protein
MKNPLDERHLVMINVGRYRFEGPVYSKDLLKDTPGVYTVLDDRTPNGILVLDVGESEQVKTRIGNHDREDCWLENRRARICYAALYMPGSTQPQRQAVEAELRNQFSPTCGVR